MPEEPTLLRWVQRPDGRRELLEFPLTRELFLDPQPGDTLLQGERHDTTAEEIAALLRNHLRTQADVRVFHGMKHYLLPRQPAPSPDVSVVRGLRPGRPRSSFQVKTEGLRPCLLIEVVSPGTEARHTDLVDKVGLYRTAGIPEYLIVDSPSGVTGQPFTLVAYRLDAAGLYQSLMPDAEGRVLSETAGVWFQVSPDGQRILLFEAPSGRRLLSLEEQEARAEAAEAEVERLRAEIERLRRE